MTTAMMEYLNLFNKYGWFLLIILLERVFQARKLTGLHNGFLSDLIHTFDPWVKPILVVWVVQLIQPHFPDVALKGALSTAPLVINLIILAIISEVSFYFIHRMTHSNSILWEFHRVHHSSTEYQSVMTSRFHPIDAMLFEAPYLLTTIWLGFPFEALWYFGLFRGFMDRFGHSNINVPHLNSRIIGTPHFHAWHHASEPQAFGKNFSRDFVFMDYIFHTAYYPKNCIPQKFGEPNYPTNYFVQIFFPFAVLWKRIFRTNTK